MNELVMVSMAVYVEHALLPSSLAVLDEQYFKTCQKVSETNHESGYVHPTGVSVMGTHTPHQELLI